MSNSAKKAQRTNNCKKCGNFVVKYQDNEYDSFQEKHRRALKKDSNKKLEPIYCNVCRKIAFHAKCLGLDGGFGLYNQWKCNDCGECDSCGKKMIDPALIIQCYNCDKHYHFKNCIDIFHLPNLDDSGNDAWICSSCKDNGKKMTTTSNHLKPNTKSTSEAASTTTIATTPTSKASTINLRRKGNVSIESNESNNSRLSTRIAERKKENVDEQQFDELTTLNKSRRSVLMSDIANADKTFEDISNTSKEDGTKVRKSLRIQFSNKAVTVKSEENDGEFNSLSSSTVQMISSKRKNIDDNDQEKKKSKTREVVDQMGNKNTTTASINSPIILSGDDKMLESEGRGYRLRQKERKKYSLDFVIDGLDGNVHETVSPAELLRPSTSPSSKFKRRRSKPIFIEPTILSVASRELDNELKVNDHKIIHLGKDSIRTEPSNKAASVGNPDKSTTRPKIVYFMPKNKPASSNEQSKDLSELLEPNNSNGAEEQHHHEGTSQSLEDNNSEEMITKKPMVVHLYKETTSSTCLPNTYLPGRVRLHGPPNRNRLINDLAHPYYVRPKLIQSNVQSEICIFVNNKFPIPAMINEGVEHMEKMLTQLEHRPFIKALESEKKKRAMKSIVSCFRTRPILPLGEAEMMTDEMQSLNLSLDAIRRRSIFNKNTESANNLPEDPRERAAAVQRLAAQREMQLREIRKQRKKLAFSSSSVDWEGSLATLSSIGGVVSAAQLLQQDQVLLDSTIKANRLMSAASHIPTLQSPKGYRPIMPKPMVGSKSADRILSSQTTASPQPMVTSLLSSATFSLNDPCTYERNIHVSYKNLDGQVKYSNEILIVPPGANIINNGKHDQILHLYGVRYILQPNKTLKIPMTTARQQRAANSSSLQALLNSRSLAESLVTSNLKSTNTFGGLPSQRAQEVVEIILPLRIKSEAYETSTLPMIKVPRAQYEAFIKRLAMEKQKVTNQMNSTGVQPPVSQVNKLGKKPESLLKSKQQQQSLLQRRSKVVKGSLLSSHSLMKKSGAQQGYLKGLQSLLQSRNENSIRKKPSARNCKTLRLPGSTRKYKKIKIRSFERDELYDSIVNITNVSLHHRGSEFEKDWNTKFAPNTLITNYMDQATTWNMFGIQYVIHPKQSIYIGPTVGMKLFDVDSTLIDAYKLQQLSDCYLKEKMTRGMDENNNEKEIYNKAFQVTKGTVRMPMPPPRLIRFNGNLANRGPAMQFPLEVIIQEMMGKNKDLDYKLTRLAKLCKQVKKRQHFGVRMTKLEQLEDEPKASSTPAVAASASASSASSSSASSSSFSSLKPVDLTGLVNLLPHEFRLDRVLSLVNVDPTEVAEVEIESTQLLRKGRRLAIEHSVIEQLERSIVEESEQKLQPMRDMTRLSRKDYVRKKKGLITVLATKEEIEHLKAHFSMARKRGEQREEEEEEKRRSKVPTAQAEQVPKTEEVIYEKTAKTLSNDSEHEPKVKEDEGLGEQQEKERLSVTKVVYKNGVAWVEAWYKGKLVFSPFEDLKARIVQERHEKIKEQAKLEKQRKKAEKKMLMMKGESKDDPNGMKNNRVVVSKNVTINDNDDNKPTCIDNIKDDNQNEMKKVTNVSQCVFDIITID